MNLPEQIDQLRKGERIEFSVISGYNYYSIPPQSNAGEPILVALHRDTDILYKMYPGEVLNRWEAKEQIRWHRDFVIRPVRTKQIEWPVDLVKIKFEEGGAPKEQLYYVFQQKPMLDMQPLKKLLYVNKKNDMLDWRNELIRRVVCSFLEAMSDLHDGGYTYNDFDIRRIMYDTGTGQIYLRHTSAIRKSGVIVARNRIAEEQLAMEFAPPCSGVDRDLYAVAAILFRLMIGRLPYQGWPLENNTHVFDSNYYDLDRQEVYQNYFREYKKSRVFIFDPDDDSNRLSPGSEDDLPRERWEALPGRIRFMFIQSLAYTDEKKRDKMFQYTVKQWLCELKRCCW